MTPIKSLKGPAKRTESAFLRKLVDEALAARCQKDQSLPLTEESAMNRTIDFTKIESLLMRLVRQGETSFRIQDVCWHCNKLPLLKLMRLTNSQEFVAKPRLCEEAIGENELETQFAKRMDQAKTFAFGLANEIK